MAFSGRVNSSSLSNLSAQPSSNLPLSSNSAQGKHSYGSTLDIFSNSVEKNMSKSGYHHPGGMNASPAISQKSWLVKILFPWTRVEVLSREMILKGTVSAIVGLALGIISSLIINCTLVEISVSSFFSMYLGLVFITVGSVIIWRVHANTPLFGTHDAAFSSFEFNGAGDFNSKAGEGGVECEISVQKQRTRQIVFFAGLVIISGILCFVLSKNWFVGLHPLFKVPIYTILGVSVAFALTFSLVDVINYVFSCIQPSMVAKPLVESKEQAYMVLLFTLIMGATFGFIFGLLDVEDELQYHIRLALLREQQFCYPLGAILGGLAGFGNEIQRQQDYQAAKQCVTEFDEDI